GGGTGLAPNVASMLAYLGCLVTGIIFVVIEKDNKDVKFHAWQSIFLAGTSLALWIVSFVLGMIPVIGLLAVLLHIVGGIGLFVVWIIAMIKAYQGQRWVIPVIGPLAEQQAAK